MKPTVVTSQRVLSIHDAALRAPAVEIARLARALELYPEAGVEQSSATSLLETQVAEILGQEAAVLMPTGKMAQQIALRIHADRRGAARVTLAHPGNHLSLWEDSNYARLHDLYVRHVGDRHRLLSAGDLAPAVSMDDVASVLWELPQRELGGELPEWDALQEQLSLAADCGVATHLDGARIWQAGPYYGRPLAQIGGAFDSVYVSLYKDLGAPRGAVLAGSNELVSAARGWRQRMGGTIDEAWPLALLAVEGLNRVLPRMPDLVEHAQAIAAEIHRSTTATVQPAVPQTAMFHVHLPVPAEAARSAHEQMVQRGGLGLALRIRTSTDPRRSCFETTVGAEALSIAADQVASAIRELLAIADEQMSTSDRCAVHQEIDSRE